MKLIFWYCDWIVLEECFHLVNFVILNAECILASVVDKCVEYCLCLCRDEKMFILWKVLWKKYCSSVPSMHQMEFIIHWTWRKNRITLLKLMKLEGKDLEVNQETCATHTMYHITHMSYLVWQYSAASTKACHWSLSWDSSIHLPSSHFQNIRMNSSLFVSQHKYIHNVVLQCITIGACAYWWVWVW